MNFIANIIPGATGASGSKPNATDLSGKPGENENSPFATLVSDSSAADAAATSKTDIKLKDEAALNMAALLFENQNAVKPAGGNGNPLGAMPETVPGNISDLAAATSKPESAGLISSWQQTAANMQGQTGNLEKISLAGHDKPFPEMAALKANGLLKESGIAHLPEISAKSNMDQATLNSFLAAKAGNTKSDIAAKAGIKALGALAMDASNPVLAAFAKINTAPAGKPAPDLVAAMINGGETSRPGENSTSSLAFESTLNISTDKPQSFQAILNSNQTETKPSVLPVNTVAIEMARQFKAGSNRFNIRLDPPELGRIDVRMDVSKEGQVTAHLIVEKPETLSALNKDAQALERALNASGLETKENGLNFSLSNGNHSFEGDEEAAGSNHKDDTGILGAHEIEAAGANRTLRGYISPAGVDIHV